jgi:formylglycine-generating enzyme required for sulfatase activity
VNLLPNPNKYDNWVPQDARFDDGAFLPAEVGRYAPNPFGLHDMHGNAWEWTASEDGAGRCIVKGGSWYDRPYRAAADYRMAYDAWQPAFNVGFRVVCPAE